MTEELANSPLLQAKDFSEPSLFIPENLFRDARRQKNTAQGRIPSLCVLDPDGDIVRRLRREGKAILSPVWPCYHSELYEFELPNVEGKLGIVGCAVGASYAVLVAEQLFVSGCESLVSITSAGQIVPRGSLPYFVLIEKALRDEGTSHHYMPPARFSFADLALLSQVRASICTLSEPVHVGASWTTDAPFRETENAINERRTEGIATVEMEAAALYAFASAQRKRVICFAHVTNQMGQREGDFEKGDADGTSSALELIGMMAGLLGRSC